MHLTWKTERQIGMERKIYMQPQTKKIRVGSRAGGQKNGGMESAASRHTPPGETDAKAHPVEDEEDAYSCWTKARSPWSD